MPLTLITGRANTGKTGRALAIYKDALSTGGTPVLILPSGPDVERARAELAADATLGLSVMGFDAYVSMLWEEVGDGRRIVSPAQRRALIKRAAAGQEISGSGMVRLVSRAVQHMAAAGEGWRSLSMTPGSGSPVSRIARAYAAELQTEGLLESGEAAAAVAGRQRDTIIFHRFSDLTLAEENFVRAASDGGAHVAVTLTWEDGFPPTESLDSLVGRMVQVAFDHEHIAASSRYTTDSELRRIEAELFESPEPGEMSGSVVFLMAEGPEAEADVVVGHVRDLIEHGIEPQQIAVVFRDVRRRAGSLRRAFGEAHIQADIDMPVKFADIPFGRAYAHAVEFGAWGRRVNLLALMRSGYFCNETDETSRLIRGWLARGTQDQHRLIAQAADLGPWQKGTLQALRDCGRDCEKDALLWDELASRMFAQRHGEGECVEEDLTTDAAARASLVRLLEDLRSLGGQNLGAQSLSDALAEYTIGTHQVERPGHVQVTSAERVRGRRFAAVVLGGLAAGEFPNVSEDPLRSRVLQAMWLDAGVAPPEARGASTERALLYSVVTRPRSNLALARPLTEASGDSTGASVFWHELRDFYRYPIDEDDQTPLDKEYVLRAHEAGLSRESASSRRAALRDEACCLAGDEVALEASTRVVAALGRSHRCLAGDEESVLEDFAQADTFSPSSLETYARCPYLWFLNRAVGARSVEFEVDALLKGSLGHTALEIFYRERLGTRPADSAAESEIALWADAAMKLSLAAEGVPESEHRALQLDLAPRVRRSLRADATFLPEFTPSEAEWSFGGDGEPQVSLGPYHLRGRVDRVDTSGDQAVVVDYKLGEVSRFAAAKIVGGLEIQAPLYAHAVASSLGVPVVGAFYRGLSDGRTRGIADADHLSGGGLSRRDLVTHAQYTETIDWALQTALEAAEGIRSGVVERRGGDHCRYCPISGWCREGK